MPTAGTPSCAVAVPSCGRRPGPRARREARQPEDQLHHDWLLYDFGQATAHMMLAAADLGIGSGHSAVRDQGQAQRVLGFPDGYLAVYLIGLGYPAGRPLRPIARPDRRPFDDVVHWDHW